MFQPDRRTWTAVVGGVALVLGVSACGSGADAPAVASAPTRPAVSASAGATTNAVTAYVDGQRAWVKCMRKQGYDVPDPDSKGFVDFGAFLATAKLPKTDPGIVAAQVACESVQKPMPAELSGEVPLTAKQIGYLREYAKCMRANGIPTWPDPGPDGEWPNAGALGSETQSDAQESDNERAIQVCDPVLAGKPKASYDPSKKAEG